MKDRQKLITLLRKQAKNCDDSQWDAGTSRCGACRDQESFALRSMAGKTSLSTKEVIARLEEARR